MHEDLLKNSTQFLSRLPGVAAIFLSGSRAQGKSHKHSDIDLFIIAQPGRIWTARFFVYLTLFIQGTMRRNRSTKNSFCPNHFITADSLEIQEKDAYSAHLFSHNKPLHDLNNIFVQFAKTNQPWVQNFGESFDGKWLMAHSLWENKTPHKIRSFPQKLIESILKHIQIAKIKRNPDSKLPGAKIILTDTELRFHPRPKNRLWKSSRGEKDL